LSGRTRALCSLIICSFRLEHPCAAGVQPNGMISSRLLAAALLSAAVCAAETTVDGKWNCTNIQPTGQESPWSLLIREDGGKLIGSLTDGEADVQLSKVRLAGTVFSFRFYINAKPYTFEGKIDGARLEGKYSGAEAAGTLRCSR